MKGIWGRGVTADSQEVGIQKGVEIPLHRAGEESYLGLAEGMNSRWEMYSSRSSGPRVERRIPVSASVFTQEVAEIYCSR